MMTLKKLELERQDYDFRPHKGKHVGKAVFDCELGEVQIIITPDMAHRIFLVAAEGIIGVAKEAANALVLEAQASIAKDVKPTAIGARA